MKQGKTGRDSTKLHVAFDHIVLIPRNLYGPLGTTGAEFLSTTGCFPKWGIVGEREQEKVKGEEVGEWQRGEERGAETKRGDGSGVEEKHVFWKHKRERCLLGFMAIL